MYKHDRAKERQRLPQSSHTVVKVDDMVDSQVNKDENRRDEEDHIRNFNYMS